MQATMTTLPRFPCCLSWSANPLMTGSNRAAVRAAMESVERTRRRPPRVERRPWRCPLSSAWGATPTRAEIAWRLSRPSSGSSATSAAGGGVADARDPLEEVQPLFPVVVGSHEVEDGAAELRDVLGDGLQLALHAPADQLRHVVPEPVGLGDAGPDELPTSGDEPVELGLILRDLGDVPGPDVAAEAGDDPGVDGVGLGEDAQGLGVVADLAGVDDRDAVPSVDEGGDDGRWRSPVASRTMRQAPGSGRRARSSRCASGELGTEGAPFRGAGGRRAEPWRRRSPRSSRRSRPGSWRSPCLADAGSPPACDRDGSGGCSGSFY